MKSHRHPQRRNRGAILAESAAAIIVLTIVLIAGFAMFVCVGTWCIYKIKVGAVCNSLARNMAGCYSWNSNVMPAKIEGVAWQQPKAVDLANTLLPGMGLPQISPGNLSIQDDGTSLTVNITVVGLAYPFGKMIAMPIFMTDCASADLAVHQPPALCRIYSQADPELTWLAPCYGTYGSAAGGFWKDPITAYHVFKIGIPGDVQYSITP